MYSIGFEITKNNVKTGIVKNCEKPELIEVTFSPLGDTVCDTMKSAIEEAKALCEKYSADFEDILYIGITLEGTVCENKVYGSVFGDEIDFTCLKNKFPSKNITVISKGNALALAEEAVTYKKGYSFAYISLDDTIGFGLTVDGKPYVGANGMSPDIAHTTVSRGGKKCSCGNDGCFEAYCNFEAFKSLDREEYVSYLACGITNVMNIFQPNVIVVGGEVARAGGDELVEAFSEIVNTEQYARNSEEKTLITLPSLDANAAVIGAAIASL